jgi:5-formyltetrahydrofolate cyclo-ligase
MFGRRESLTPGGGQGDGDAIARRKAAERQAVLSCRDLLPPETRRILSQGVGRRLFSLPEFARARSVLFYIAFRSEVETQALIERALALGKEVAVPVARAEPRGLIPCRYTCQADLARTSLGVLEPRPECACPVEFASIDLVVVPGTAFDLSGRRLGYGLGYYDRLLAEMNQALRVALAFECQMLPEVPVEPHDLPVDIVLTEERELRTRARRR